VDYVNQILDDPQVAGNAPAIKALLDVKSTLAMVIDDTGSMGGLIDTIKTVVTNIVNSVADTDDEPARYVLVRFGDPDVGPPVVTANAQEFLTAVDALEAHEGGDCPELSMTALSQAIGASQNDATLYLFTDASAKDDSLESVVKATAQDKRIKIIEGVFGFCSPIDPVYARIARATGGQLFTFTFTQADKLFLLLEQELLGNFVNILSLDDTINAETREVDVPIDSTVESATFSIIFDVEGTRGEIELFRPSGLPVLSTDPGVTINTLGAEGQLFRVNSPEAGLWRLRFTGLGAFTLQALANSDLRFDRFEFVTLTGRPGHEGLFPIPAQPVASGPHTGLASLLGPFGTASFTLVSEADDSLQVVNLAQGDPNTAADEFVGSLALPVQPFRVAVSGVDENGFLYQRLFPTLFRIQSVEVTPNIGFDTVAAGATTPLSFTVRNLGAAGNFEIIAADNQGFLTQEPIPLTLGSGESDSVLVNLSVPPEAVPGLEIMLALTATSAADPTITNSAVVVLTVTEATEEVVLPPCPPCGPKEICPAVFCEPPRFP
jgi:hypothetical protein